MSIVKVTYFKTLDIRSKNRVLPTIGHAIPQLVEAVASNMNSDESFACFTAPDGQIIAVYKQAQFVMV